MPQTARDAAALPDLAATVRASHPLAQSRAELRPASYAATVTVELPWPESPERVKARVRGLVESVVFPDELLETRLEWVTPSAHEFDSPHAGWVALRLTVVARGDEAARWEIWGAEWLSDWERALEDLASNLEDWVCETRFAWGELRSATVPR